MISLFFYSLEDVKEVIVLSESQLHGVAGLKKHKMKVHSIVFMIYCLVAAGAFGLEDMVSSGGPGITIILLTVFPFIWAFPICNMASELTSILPDEGGRLCMEQSGAWRVLGISDRMVDDDSHLYYERYLYHTGRRIYRINTIHMNLRPSGFIVKLSIVHGFYDLSIF